MDEFIFPSDYTILDCEADPEVPIIVGRQFLATVDIVFNVRKRDISMKVNNEEVKFNVLNAMKLPGDLEECSAISTSGTASFQEFFFIC